MVICDFAKTIQSLFRENDVVGRIGGDEFVAFMTIPNERCAIEKAEKMVNSLNKDFTNNESTWHMSASIGLVVTDGTPTDYITLYSNADSALYKSKNDGKNRYSIYTEE